MKATQTLCNTKLQKYNRWLRSQNPTKPLPNTLNSTCQPCKVLPKSLYFGTSTLAYHAKRKKAVGYQTQVKAPGHSNHNTRNSQTNTNLMIEIQISVPDVVIPHMHKDLTAWQRSTNANIAQKLDTSPECALPKMHTNSHNTIRKVSQNRHIKSLYLNILLNSIRIHMTVIMIVIL